MRNALFSSVPPQLYDFGNNEVQLPNLDISVLQVDSVVTNISRNGIAVDSKIFKDDCQLRDGGFDVSCQSLINYQQGYQSFASFDNISQQSLVRSRKRSLPQVEMDFQSLQNNLLRQEGIGDPVSNKTASNVSKKGITKKKKVNTSCEEQWHHQVKDSSIEFGEHKVPVRRCQRLSDKITALQKLVSPYGKTDTASVLQEASLYIKLLQEQIQNLFQMLSSSYSDVRALHSQEIAGKQIDLRSRGLCLVPISFTQQVTKEDSVNPHDMSKELNDTSPTTLVYPLHQYSLTP